MIKLFRESDTNFVSNGDKIIIPKKAIIHKEDNGSFYLDLETDLSYIEYLSPNKIIVTNTPNGNQAFRIGNIDKTRKKISLRAYHIFYDTKNYLIQDSYVIDKNCNEALNHLNNATDNTSPFSVYSNVSTINSFRCVRKSLYESINTTIERWGGHLVRDNFNIKILNSIEEDHGVIIRYGKNLKEITCEEKWDDVVTKLLPVGKDGLLLPEIYLTSNVQYNIPYTKAISFNQDINAEDYPTQEAYQNALIIDLRSQANEYLKDNCIPKVNYTVKANVDKITDVGNKIEVYDERLNINIFTNVISYDYNCITKKFEEVEFGNFKNKLSDLISKINDSTKKEIVFANEEIYTTIQDVSNEIWETLDSDIVTLDGKKIMIYDSLPHSAANKVAKINNMGVNISEDGENGSFTNIWNLNNVMHLNDLYVNNENILNRIAGLGQVAKTPSTSNWNTACGESTGFYKGTDFSNSPNNENSILVLHIAFGEKYQRQLAFSLTNSNGIYTRIMNNGNWTSWASII